MQINTTTTKTGTPKFRFEGLMFTRSIFGKIAFFITMLPALAPFERFFESAGHGEVAA